MSQGISGQLEAERGKEGSPSRVFIGLMVLPTPSFGACGL